MQEETQNPNEINSTAEQTLPVGETATTAPLTPLGKLNRAYRRKVLAMLTRGRPALKPKQLLSNSALKRQAEKRRAKRKAQQAARKRNRR